MYMYNRHKCNGYPNHFLSQSATTWTHIARVHEGAGHPTTVVLEAYMKASQLAKTAHDPQLQVGLLAYKKLHRSRGSMLTSFLPMFQPNALKMARSSG